MGMTTEEPIMPAVAANRLPAGLILPLIRWEQSERGKNSG